jgi:hypothetical protein
MWVERVPTEMPKFTVPPSFALADDDYDTRNDVANALGVGVVMRLRDLYGESVEFVETDVFKRICIGMHYYNDQERKSQEAGLSQAALTDYQSGVQKVVDACEAERKDGMKLKVQMPLFANYEHAEKQWVIYVSMKWEAPTTKDESKKTELG